MGKLLKILNSNLGIISIVVVVISYVIAVFIDPKNGFFAPLALWLYFVFLLYIAVEVYRNYLQHLTPFDKIKKALLDFDGWEKTEDLHWYYKSAPEYTIIPTDEDTWEVTGGENWVRASINPKAYVRPMQLKYHQTILQTLPCIYFDEMREFIPAPSFTIIPNATVIKDEWFYSICADDFDFLFLQFLLKKQKIDLIENGIPAPRINGVPVIIFSSNTEKRKFLNHLENVKINYSQSHYLTLHSEDPLVSNQDRIIIAYSFEVMEELKRFRKSQ